MVKDFLGSTPVESWVRGPSGLKIEDGTTLNSVLLRLMI